MQAILYKPGATLPFGRDALILPDTNIWMYLLKTAANAGGQFDQIAEQASNCFASICRIGCRLATSEIVLLELANLLFAQDFDAWKNLNAKPTASRKEYRKSSEFGTHLSYLNNLFTQIQDMGTEVLGNSALANVTDYLGAIKVGFADHLIARVCRENNAILFTTDLDMATHCKDVQLLTTNPKLHESTRLSC